MTSVFDEVGPAALMRYLQLCGSVHSFDMALAHRRASFATRYYNGDESCRSEMVAQHALEQRWYASLEGGVPDYTVYGDDHFVADVWACWVVYSRKYLRALRTPGCTLDGASVLSWMLPHVGSLVDLGCGFGYTTAGLKELFPNAVVSGTQIEGTFQYRVASRIGVGRGFQVRGEVTQVGHADLVFASEYFEHFEKPIEHLTEILDTCAPSFLVVANAFGSSAIGHFNSYLAGDTRVPNTGIGRLFNAELRRRGYVAVKTKMWNNRPAVWVKGNPVVAMEIKRNTL